MNCSECEQLLDAYLDGQLTGSLRLEFDAHRLRCRRCQQTLAMLEACANVISSDTQIPQLSDGFTERVLETVSQPEPRVVRFPLRRVAIIAGAIVQAAAVLAFAVMWNTPEVEPAAAPVSGAAVTGVSEGAGSAGSEAIRDLIVERVEERLWDMHLAGVQWTTDLYNLARFCQVMVPEEVARESSQMASGNPWDAIWETLRPVEEEEAAPTLVADGIHSI
jgi:hypothetical protein